MSETQPSHPPGHLPPPQLDLRVERRGDLSFLAQRLFSSPFVLTRTFHLERQPAHMLSIVTQTSAGALCAGDDLFQRIRVEGGAAVTVRNQGATAVHRASGAKTASEHVELHVAAGGHLEFLPEPKVLFPGAALRQRLRLVCAPGGSAVLSDAFLLHDPTDGARQFRSYASEILVFGDDPAPMVVERVELPRLPAWSGRRTRLHAFGTLFAILTLPEAELEALRDAVHAASDIEGVYGAASLLPRRCGVMLRLACQDGGALRTGLERGWSAVRRALFGAEPRVRMR